jgi:putative CRISPR-associated protein (TIGR02619 family)
MASNQPTLMLSPCGTSLFTNLAGNDERTLLRKYANAPKSVIEKRELNQLEHIIDHARNQLLDSNFQDVCKHSAELNAISRYYDMGQTINQQDIHILLASDTWLGKQTAHLVKEWLSQHVNDVRIKEQKDLITNNLMQFQLAMSDLIKYFEDWIEPYRRPIHHVVFNLTGGFKSVQGFLQTLAMFYADEAIYIFQSQDELLRLPRLPVKMDAEGVIKNHLITCRRLSRNLRVNEEQMDSIPEVFYIEMDNEYSLSPWGKLIWNQQKKSIFKGKVFESPDKKIVYSNKFKKSVEGLPSDRNYNLNLRIGDLMVYLNTGEQIDRLNFKPLSGNPIPGSTHEFDAWADRDAKRVYCHYESDTIILDKLDSALH